MREPWTDPLTLRERFLVKWWNKRDDVRRFFHETIPMKIAWHLPNEVAKWAVIRAAAKAHSASKNTYPDQITYPMMHDVFEPNYDA